MSHVDLKRSDVWTALIIATALIVARGELEAQDSFADVERVVREELHQKQAPGAAIAIVEDGRVVYTRGFGVANVETGDATRPEMLFRLGSTTKMFTAAAVVLLALQQTLDLHEPIGKHIPGLAPKLAALTPHQLLSHTAGVLDEAPMFGRQDEDALKNEAASWTDARLFANPGEIYSYSNPGYWLAGLLAEQAGGKPFAEQMTTSIFAPLGMSRSTFRPTMAMTYPIAQGHDLIAGKPQIIRPSANNAASWPAGSLFSSVLDLSRWIEAFVNQGVVDGKQVLPATLFTTMAQPSAVIPGSNNMYGYGVQLSDWRGMPLVSHGGSRSGYGSVIRIVPSRRFGVVVLANRTGVEMSRSAEAAMEAALKPPPVPAPVAPKTLALSAADRARFAGVYSQGMRQITIEARGDDMFVRQGVRDVQLQRLGDLEFSAGELRFVLVTDPDGAVTFLHTGGRSWKKLK